MWHATEAPWKQQSAVSFLKMTICMHSSICCAICLCICNTCTFRRCDALSWAETHQRTTHSNTSHKTSQSSCIFLQSFDMFEVWTAVCTAWSTFILAEGIFSRTLCDSHLLVESEIGYKTMQNSLWILQNYKYTKLYWPAIGHSEECVQQASTSWSQLQLVGAPLMELELCSLSTGFPFFCLESL